MFTKEEIIKKVQEWAKENNGFTPSEKHIREDLGLYRWHWTDYWEKITDLQRDAGLVPHKFDKTKYSRKDLCKLFIKVMRIRGKWPTKDVLEREHRHNSSFPHSVTIYKKLGLTYRLANTILEYAQDKKGYNDVVEICNETIKRYKNKQDISETDSVIPGYVYLGIQKGDYKIGYSKDPGRRREDISTMASEPFQTIHEIKTDDMKGVERYWHNRFKSKLLRGEWYKLNSSDVKAFKRWKRLF